MADFPPDEKLTDHFGLYEMTQTSTAPLQDANREQAVAFISSLKALAMMLEQIRMKVGPMRIHSAFRCPALNNSTPGSSKKSQHMKGEAADFSAANCAPSKENVDAFFEQVLSACIEKAVPFGQLIRETAQRNYGTVDWVHISLGVPFRDKSLCGQVLKMEDGKYTLIKQINMENI